MKYVYLILNNKIKFVHEQFDTFIEMLCYINYQLTTDTELEHLGWAFMRCPVINDVPDRDQGELISITFDEMKNCYLPPNIIFEE